MYHLLRRIALIAKGLIFLFAYFLQLQPLAYLLLLPKRQMVYVLCHL
tara:strand:- start:287 stop:427 length:141 start_codon:yes stop_codon:yes gene_type:complete